LNQRHGKIAQLVEQRTENPRVLGSIPSLATTLTAGIWGFLGPGYPGLKPAVR
jgi:hypothetical protein